MGEYIMVCTYNEISSSKKTNKHTTLWDNHRGKVPLSGYCIKGTYL